MLRLDSWKAFEGWVGLTIFIYLGCFSYFIY